VQRAAVWRAGTLTALESPAVSLIQVANGVSADGRTIVGLAWTEYQREAFRWTNGNLTIVRALGVPRSIAQAFDVSSDGEAIAGEAIGSMRGCRWSESNYAVVEPIWTYGDWTRTEAISADGRTLVGYALDDDLYEVPIYWRDGVTTGMGHIGGYPYDFGRALDVNADGRIIVGVDRQQAFYWDSVGGMRSLRSVLEDELGIEVPTGWSLTSANAISDNGRFIVGRAYSGAHGTRGFLAELPAICQDGRDNDGDGLIDAPNDPGCLAASSATESPECDDDSDNDGDGHVDFGADSTCISAAWVSEQSTCTDGLDNDDDGVADFPLDPGCASPISASESPPCDDGVDNDSDGMTDHPSDPGCTLRSSVKENPECSDGRDNDDDNAVDYPQDQRCTGYSDDAERCGLGFELALFILPLSYLRRPRSRPDIVQTRGDC
jgi:probable HAF family extracellular repeat protein